jgi:glycosyltransferase involved in cell wall biosynthesis
MPDAASIHSPCSANPVKWIALLGRPDKPTDGVEDYCTFLAKALEARGTAMSLARVSWMEDGWFDGLRKLWRESVKWRGQWVLLQYTALSWSRRGIPFGALATLAILRRHRVRCAVVFHESSRQSQFSTRWIDRIRGASQDWVIRRLYNGAAKAIFTSALEGISWLWGMQNDHAAFIPIGANIPERVHRRTGPTQPGKVKAVIVFGVSDSPETAAPEVNIISAVMLEACKALGKLRLVVAGRGALEAGELFTEAFQGRDIDLVVHGVLAAEKIADKFESADALLFVRGPITTRRGSVMAGIACGVPIVGYRGPEVSSMLEAAGVEWCTLQDRESLARGLIRVLSDSQRWMELHQRNLEMQKNYFSWNRIAERFQAVLAP